MSHHDQQAAILKQNEETAGEHFYKAGLDDRQPRQVVCGRCSFQPLPLNLNDCPNCGQATSD